MKFIKDPIHGFIEVEAEINELLDSPPMQRLRYIKQLGFSYLVYPGANHSRFEHSLGAMHLARLMCRHLRLDDAEQKVVTIAALLHDSGHGPFSHTTEPFMKEYIGHGHEQVDQIIHSGPIIKVLDNCGIDPSEISHLIQRDHFLSTLIHGDLDVDRMDYLRRDAHYTGVPYGTVDAHRLIQSTVLSDHGLILDESGINAAESLLIARTLMRPAVYLHHVSRIASSMLTLALVKHCNGRPDFIQRQYMNLDDAGLLMELIQSGNEITKMLTERLYYRQLYKRALFAGPDQVNAVALQGEPITIRGSRKVAEEIASCAGVNDWEVIVDIPPLPQDIAMDVLVQNKQAIIRLADMSPLIDTLNKARRSQWRIGVYSPKEVLKVVERAAIDILHVKKATKQDRLSIDT